MRGCPILARPVRKGGTPLKCPARVYYSGIFWSNLIEDPEIKMKANRIFVSHSSLDKEFANLAVARLRKADMVPWADSENILVGDDILDGLGSGLKTMDLFVLIVSAASLKSSWVEREVKFAIWQEIKRKEALVLPFIIDDTAVEELPWYLTKAHARHIGPDAAGAEVLAGAVRDVIARRSAFHSKASEKAPGVRRDLRLDRLIQNVGLGDWESATHAALEMVRATDFSGHNELLRVLINYIDLHEDDTLLWSALHTIECYAELAPSQFDYATLSRMASHQNFSVRSTVASICMRWAQFAPDRIPVDVLLKLSVYDEDWYVEAPANAALKSMARSVRGILGIFFARLRSQVAEERAHAAHAILEIAKKEAEILDPAMIEAEIKRLRSVSDKLAISSLLKAAALVKKTSYLSGYKYGL